MSGLRSQLIEMTGYSKLRPMSHLHAVLMEQLADIPARHSAGAACELRHAAAASDRPTCGRDSPG